MSNVVEFILQLKDLMSSGMQNAAVTAKKTMQTAERAVDSVGKKAKETAKHVKTEMTEVVNSVSAATAKAGGVVNRALGSIGGGVSRVKNMLGGSGGLLGAVVGGNLIATAISGVSKVISSGISSAISAVFKKEQNITALSTFLGKEGATAAFADIQKDAAATPFGADALLAVNTALISAGTNAQRARQDTLNLANAVSAVGGGNDVLQRMAANMQQIKTVGKATSMDIRQFAMAGINIYQLLSDATGKSIQQVQEMDVSYDLLSASFAKAAAEGGLYYGAMEAQAKTLAGRWATFKEGVAGAVTSIGDAIKPGLDAVMELISAFGQKLPGYIAAMKPLFDGVNAAIVGIVSWIRSGVNYVREMASGANTLSGHMVIVRTLFNSVWQYAKTILGVVFGIVGGIVDWLMKSEILKDIFSSIVWLVSNVYEVIGWIVTQLKWVFDNVLMPILDAIEKAYRFIKSMTGADNTVEVVASIPKKAAFNPLGDMSKYQNSPTFDAASSNAAAVGGSPSGVNSRGVTSSGPRTITINIEKEMIGQVAINSINMKEGVAETETMLEEMLRRVLLSVAAG